MEKFIIPYKDKIYRFVLRMVGSTFDAEDILQELAIKIWKKKESFSELENKEAWCMTVARNMAIDKIRSRKKRQYIDVTEAYDISDQGKDPYEKTVSRDNMSMLKSWMEKLPEKQKMALHLREVEGMTYKEIAEILEISLEQVKSNIFRGRQALREMLKKKAVKMSNII